MRYRSILFRRRVRSAFVLQATGESLSTELRQNYNQRKSALLAEADRMPDADYALRRPPKWARSAREWLT